MATRTIQVIDSHTCGEPTRVITDGAPDLGTGPLPDRVRKFRKRFDNIRTAVLLEPRGSDVLVGALPCQPTDPTCTAGVIFFNNCGYLQMCGHGTIGLMVTLARTGKISPGAHRIETPAGVVTATLHDDHRVSVVNVPSYRFRKNVPVDVPGVGQIHGDIAWGGNWFFLVSDHQQKLAADNVAQLTHVSLRIRDALHRQGLTGANNGLIDHIELFASADASVADSRNFVLCPGGAYDRSPCGTGTSAKLACLAADGLLEPGQTFRQQSIIGTVFDATYELLPQVEPPDDNCGPVILPTITGHAWVTAQATLVLDDSDPFQFGICPDTVR